MSAQRDLADVLRAIEEAIDETPVADETSATTVFRTFDRHDLPQHLGVYVFPAREKALDNRNSAGSGLGFIEDTIQVELHYTLRGKEGQKAAIKRVAEYAKELRRIVTSAEPVARVRFDRNDYGFRNGQKSQITLTQIYLTKRTGFVGRC